MGYGTAILIILVVGLAAAAVTLVVQKAVATDLRREHHEVGSTVFLQLGVIFAVLLAFVFSEAWGEYNEASAAINSEVAALHGAAMLAATLPSPSAKEILSKEQVYLKSVIDEEWPVMAAHRTRKYSDRSEIARPDLGSGKSQIRWRRKLYKTGNAVPAYPGTSQREVRIYQAGSGIPAALWTVLIGFELILVAFVVLSGLRFWTTAALRLGHFCGFGLEHSGRRATS